MILGDLVGECCAVWIDDILLYGRNMDEYIVNLTKMLDKLESAGFKLSLKKSEPVKNEVKWCGRIIDKQGVRHDPARIQALTDLSYPKTARDVMQFLCASGWMRSSIVDYARIAEPLNKKLQDVTKGMKKTKRVANGVKIDLNKFEKDAYDTLKEAIVNTAALAFPKPDAKMCMFTDASDLGWSIIITQVLKWDPEILAHEQEHELLHCASGIFTGAQVNWSIVEKECYPVAKACSTLDHLLMRPDGFTIYCDHRNLVHMFNPREDIKKHIRGKLLRWGLQMSQYRYKLEHVAGEFNVIADMFSRWGGPKLVKHVMTSQPLPATIGGNQSGQPIKLEPKQFKKLRAVLKRRTRNVNRSSKQTLSNHGTFPNLHRLDEIKWPRIEDFEKAQQSVSATDRPKHLVLNEDGDLWMDGERVWIPKTALELLTRLCVIAHCGSMGHRGHATTKSVLNVCFSIDGFDTVVKKILDTCLLCPHVKGGKVVPRPWAPGIRTNIPNRVVSWDYLKVGNKSVEGYEYILVIKDMASHYVRLTPCVIPNGMESAKALFSWIADFGSPKVLVSDQGSHFKNKTLEFITQLSGIQQQFIVAYSPWKNGSVERANRDILQLLKVMCMEFKRDICEWPSLLKTVQHNMVHSVVPSLDGHAPIEVMTALKPDNPLKTYIDPIENIFEIDMEHQPVAMAVAAARESLQLIQQAVEEAQLKQQLLNMENQRQYQEVNFEIGDFVLRSRVDEKLANKLLVTWCGPYRVVEANEFDAFTIEHLVTRNYMCVHASRLKFYHDASLNVTQELIDHVGNQGELLAIDSLLEYRWNASYNEFEVKCHWSGFETIEDSWERLSRLYPEIPRMLETWSQDKLDLKSAVLKLKERSKSPIPDVAAQAVGGNNCLVHKCVAANVQLQTVVGLLSEVGGYEKINDFRMPRIDHG